MKTLEQLLSFVHFTHLTHKVERVARIPGETRYANVVEHSYQLALVAWYLVETNDLPLSTDLVLRYALIHDLTETYAGDTYCYDEVSQRDKHAREERARVRMQEEFPNFTELTTLIQAYEARADPESRFVYALDKLIDPLNIYLEEGKLWHEKQITLDMLLSYKDSKVALDPTIAAYYRELVLKLREREAVLFPTQKAP